MPDAQQQYDDAMFAFSQGDYVGAVKRLESVLAVEPDHFDAQLALGMAHYRLGEFATAIVEGHKAEQMRPKEQLVHTNLSLFYMRAGDKVTAEKHGLKARIAAWSDPATSPSPSAESDAELKIAQPKASPITVTGRKLPAMPWKEKKPII